MTENVSMGGSGSVLRCPRRSNITPYWEIARRARWSRATAQSTGYVGPASTVALALRRCLADLKTDVGLSRRARRAHAARVGTGPILILETDIETAEGDVKLIEFMPPRGKASDWVRIVLGKRGKVAMRTELIIRFDYGTSIPE